MAGAPCDAPPIGLASIGPYRVHRVLGQGGMGTVFLAERTEPVRRLVAVKVIKPGVGGREVIERFARERQALAMMSHESIAKVFDAGSTAAGQSYFVMEYVEGETLLRYCDGRQLALAQRIKLFCKVCAGVQHAHNKGVIHRDLKPGNLLVTDAQGEAAPKIIDFGLARATDAQLAGATLTAAGQLVGTPEYMAPEQVDSSLGAVDTRTDVYALGATLYELLVGRPPLVAPKEPESALALQARICDEEPLRLSRAIDAMGPEVAAAAAARRGSDVVTWRRALRDDLEWIVLRALEKDRTRRYTMPSELAADLERHLRLLPVEAGPPSAGYRLRKFARRHRLRMLAATLVLVASAVGGTAAFASALRAAEKARDARRSAQEHLVATQRAQESLAKYDLLANVVALREARAAVPALVPAWPERLPELEAWRRDFEPLYASISTIQGALTALRAAGHRHGDDDCAAGVEWVERAARRHGALVRAQAVRQGGAPEAAVVVEDDEDLTSADRVRLARELAGPDRTVFGREARGLAHARLAWAGSAELQHLRAEAREVLAWALVANGLDLEARRVAESPELVAQLEAAAAQVPEQLAAAARELAQNRALFGLWELPSGEAQFQHDTLQELAADVLAFRDPVSGRYAEVARRSAWAEQLAARQADPEHRRRWDAARRALQASARYRRADGTPLELRVQDGLVPIGVNPATQLLEFYHLRSAADPTRLPAHDAAGGIEVNEATGMVFVLVPGGEFAMGAQSSDPTAPHFDPEAERWESPVHRVTLEPYLMARHELTQSQWARLDHDRWPSYFTLGGTLEGQPIPVDGRFPVEQITWLECAEVARRHGLSLPTEAQWEFACRAGTETPWCPGAAATSLAGAANVRDECAREFSPFKDGAAAFDDGFPCASPVGTFRPNPLGFYDLHGNVNEWVREALVDYRIAPRPGDGLRVGPSRRTNRLFRGGSWYTPSSGARSAFRRQLRQDSAGASFGVRLARPLQR
ncbi:MAG: bifunctional serine/threonine-protein kinase/formylglycine-generating enzyme family protein [Planctomycetota bacterium]